MSGNCPFYEVQLLTPDDLEKDVLQTVAHWAYVRHVTLVDKTEHALKMRLHIDSACFIQIYANPSKSLFSYTLVLNRVRIFGRDCDGGIWHRHPFHDPESHDFSAEGSSSITLSEFLAEAQHILQNVGIL